MFPFSTLPPPPLGKPEAPELREGSEVLMNRRVDSALRSGELTRKWGNSRPERVDTPMGQPSPAASSELTGPCLNSTYA